MNPIREAAIDDRFKSRCLKHARSCRAIMRDRATALIGEMRVHGINTELLLESSVQWRDMALEWERMAGLR